MKSQWSSIRPMLIAFGIALAFGAVLMLLSGSSPLQAYGELVSGAFGPTGWTGTLTATIPVICCALAVAVPLRAGLVNLGGEGQLVGGGTAAVLVGTVFPVLPAPLSLIFAVAAAAVVGGVIGFIPAIMENKLGVPLLISSLLLSYPIIAIVSFLVRFVLLDTGTGLPQTKALPEAFHMPTFGKISGALFIVIAIIVVVVIFDRATPSGFEIRLTGLNRNFTAYSGVAVDRITLGVMIAGGAIAGVAGALLVTAFPFRFVDSALIAPGFVWTGLLAAMLARANPLGGVLAAIFFAALQVGGTAMERETFVPRELSSILQAAIIIVLASVLALNSRKKQKVS